jgi:ABC-2 type transport system ATP-binding protein
MLVATGLRKTFGQTAALDGFDLTVEPGEIVGLIGHNGAGKTTFVDVVSGLIRPDAGHVLVAGIDVATRPRSARRQLGVAPQEIALYMSVSVRANLRLFGSLAGLRRRALTAAIDDTVAVLDLESVLDKPVAVLSGGQRRRVQAATALLHRPAVLLLDEPTVGADPTTRAALLDVVRGRARDGAAVCYTTHYLPELVDLGASLAVAANGRVITRGRADHLLADLPSRLQVDLTDGRRLAVATRDPADALAAMLRDGALPVAVDIQRPTLDDLFHELEAKPCA